MDAPKTATEWQIQQQDKPSAFAKQVVDQLFRNDAAFAKWHKEPEEHVRERLRAHWPGHEQRIDVALERAYHPERRN